MFTGYRSPGHASRIRRGPHLAALLEASPAMIVLGDLDGPILDASRALLEMTGYRTDELVGHSIERLRPSWPGDRPPEIVRRLRVEGRVHDVPAQIRTRGGDVRDVVVSATLVSEGEPASIVAALTDVTSLRATERRLAHNLERLQRLSAEREHRLVRRLVGAQEAERRRIAAGIHDDSLQVLGAVNVALFRLRRRIHEAAALETLDDAEESVQLAMIGLRKLLFDLHPAVLDQEGIVAAVTASLDRLADETGIVTRLHASLTREPTPERRTTLYRIVQEALINVRKHARASSVEVSIVEERGGVRITVQDDGVGFAPKAALRPRGLGLVSMRERAQMLDGHVEVESTPGEGARVLVWVGAEPRGS